MKMLTLGIDGAPDLRFNGELVASVTSCDNQAEGKSCIRWKELALYKTKGGQYICHRVDHSRFQEERTQFSGSVCQNLDDVKSYLGQSWLAKQLYAEAKIDNFTEVE